MQSLPYKAPDFKLQDETGKWHQLSDYKGNWLVLFFYPKDFTPGCTVEVCNMRDGREALAFQTGADIVGVSRDIAKSHQDFIKEHQLTFPLLCDPEAEVISRYDAVDTTTYNGKNGVIRKTFLIDPEGMVQKIYDPVNPEGHSEQVLADLLQLQK